jgi:uncharacterized protein (TIGR02466 family)
MIEYWWPTEIGYYDNPEHNSLKLIDYCYQIKDKIKSGGQNWVSKETYNTSSEKYAPHKDKKFKKLNDWIMKQVKNYIKDSNLNYKVNNKETDSWFNVYNTGDYQEVHQHYGYVLSAVYFLKSNPNFSPLIFTPRFIDQLNIKKIEGNYDNGNVNYDAIPGRLVVFRSYLPHCVGKHMDKDDRITLAYNFR